MKTYLIVSGDFVQTGGMDIANFALASYLAEQGNEVHLVAHHVDSALLNKPNVTFHRVPKPAKSYLLGEPLLDRAGRYWAAKISARGGRVIVNGGNCLWGDVNWVHYVHAAYTPHVAGNIWRQFKTPLAHRRFLAHERRAIKGARLIIANSERTKRDIVEHFDVPAERVNTIYYGIDPERFRPASIEERRAARRMLGWKVDGITAVFIGALGDSRKGFDTLFEAWQRLCADPTWDVDLIVVGTGAKLSAWQMRAAQHNLRIQFLGFRRDVPTILAASDALIAPTRYEAYGLSVQEALCCGLPSIVTSSAGVVENYPKALSSLLLDEAKSVEKLTEMLRQLHDNYMQLKSCTVKLSEELRRYSWTEMARRASALIN
ncbi:MAG: glycosyltransferase family 4 protein [Pyrinomonadaceae bacterium MAG19_C2-C3]|nr:glycosyltransferase family 4 protein [Pyrinomonadaceae bacterium MAG19_C2-C3]